MNERRSTPRISPQSPLAARLRTSIPARICDISESGAQLEVERSLRPDVPCDFRVHCSEGEILLRAVVRRSRVWGFGVDDRGQRTLLYRAGVEFQSREPGLLVRLGLEADSSGVAPGERDRKGSTRTGRIRVKIDDTRLRELLRRK